MKKLRKLILVPVAILVLASIGFAAWNYMLNNGMTATVASYNEMPIEFSAMFSDLEMNTSISSDKRSTIVDLNNMNGPQNMTVLLNITRTDVADSCDDYLGDCTVEFLYDSSPYNNGTMVGLQPGTYPVEIELDCKAHSCPQTIEVGVRLEEV